MNRFDVITSITGDYRFDYRADGEFVRYEEAREEIERLEKALAETERMWREEKAKSAISESI